MPAVSARPLAGLLITLTAAAVVAAPALVVPAAGATPPPNDDIAAATTITSWPTQLTVDTTDATADETDGHRVGDHSVWFRLRPATSGRVSMTTSGSSYDTDLTVFQGTRADRTLTTWDRSGGPGPSASLQLQARSGTTYWIAISSGRNTPDTGGAAVLSVGQVADPHVDLVVGSATAGDVSGQLVLEGTITCTTPSQVGIEFNASQRNGDMVARGYGYRRLLCWDDPVSWRVTIQSDTGWAFQPGSVLVTSSGYVWDGISSMRVPHQSVVVPVVLAPLSRTTR